MPSILKSIALAAGAGVAWGLYSTAARAPRRLPEGSGSLDPLFIEPLLDRLERVEGQFAQGQANGDATAHVAFLKQSIAVQGAELQALRVKVDETERRAAAAEASCAERLGALERAASDQLKSIGRLADRAVETDANLQRLIAVVERLSERPLQPSSTVLPFEAQLAEAAKRDQPGESRVRVIKDNEPERRHRFPLGRTFAFFLAALLARLHR